MTDDIKGTQARSESMAVHVGDTGFTMAGLAEVFVQSGFFKGVTGQAQAIVKVLYGQELGLSPLQSMLSINMVEGRPEVAATTLGAIVKRSGKYDYRILELTDTGCTIEFFEGKAAEGVSIGTAGFNEEDARRAGLASKFNYKAYPEDMYFSRAMSRGVKRFCLDALGGAPVYVTGEIGEAQASTPTRTGVIDYAVSPQPSAEPPCPVCGVLGALLKRKDGGVTCWAKRQGCGAIWPAGTAFPPTAPPPPVVPQPPSRIHNGAEDCPIAGCWGGRDHPGAHVFEAEALKTTYADAAFWAHAEEIAMPMPTFKPFGGKVEITTAGMTQAQFEESHRLATELDKAKGKATARGILADLLGLPVEEATRKMLTEAQANEYLRLLEKAVAP